MNTLSKIFLSIAIALSIVAIVIAVKPITSNLGALQTTGENSFYGVTINDTIAASSTASTLILSANNTRQYARISNLSTDDVYLALGTTSVASKGILLTTKASYEINPLNSFKGAVYAIASTTGANLAVTEK
jgi:hypothetical protein